jgi:hypothetical protein
MLRETASVHHADLREGDRVEDLEARHVAAGFSARDRSLSTS